MKERRDDLLEVVDVGDMRSGLETGLAEIWTAISFSFSCLFFFSFSLLFFLFLHLLQSFPFVYLFPLSLFCFGYPAVQFRRA